MTSASSCSIRRRTSLIAVSELSSPQPTPTSLSGWSPIAPPVKPSFGLLGFFGLAPANCANAATAPAMFWLSNAPNAPLHSDMIATLIGVPEPPLRGATAGWGSGALAGAAGSSVLVLVDAVDVLAEPPSLSSDPPQPAAASAITAMKSASQNAPRPGPRTTAIACLLLETDTASPDRCWLGGPPLLRDVPWDHSPPAHRHALPQADEPVGRDEDDDQEDDADHRVEAIGDQVDVRGVVVDDHEHQRPQPRALEPVQAADDRDHEHVDRRVEADRRRGDLRVPPDEEDP